MKQSISSVGNKVITNSQLAEWGNEVSLDHSQFMNASLKHTEKWHAIAMVIHTEYILDLESGSLVLF